MSLLVEIEKRLGPFRLDVRFEAEAGEITALLGASGSGKSMTLKCVAGIERPDRGRIVLDGRTLFDSEKRVNLSPQKRRVGYLFQQYALFPHWTVWQNVLAGARGRSDAKQAAAAALEALRLTGLERRRPSQLSGGQQQRAALARILVNRPEALLLDEPFSALDESLRWDLELELSETLKSSFSCPVVFVSHNRQEVRRLCGSVCALSDGRSEPKRPALDFFARPETRAAALLGGVKNLSRAEKASRGRYRAADWGVELDAGGRAPAGTAFLGVRSSALSPAPLPEGTNVFPCVLERLWADEGGVTAVLIPPSGAARLTMALPGEGSAGLREGKTVFVTVPPEKILLLKE